MNLLSWQQYIEQVCGFVLPEVQNNWLTHAIATTAQNQNMSADELYHALTNEQVKKSGQLPTLTQLLLNNLLIAESRFFRHEPSLAFIGKCYEKAMNAKPPRSEPFSVWSVGCSTGQEVYSVAMTLRLSFKQMPEPLPFKVYGSDLSVRSLDVAKQGKYKGRQMNEIPARYRPQIQILNDDSGTFKHQKTWQIHPKTAEHTQFFWHNIFAREAVDLPKQDVIICQNVLIYFRKFDQQNILAYFVQNLAVGGYLLFAPNEAMFWQHPQMKRVDDGQINAWQKISE